MRRSEIVKSRGQNQHGTIGGTIGGTTASSEDAFAAELRLSL